MKLFISLFAVAVIAVSLSRTVKLSSKYERTPEKNANRKLSDWNALDHGIDPTNEDETGDVK
jgi:hypothetical protein